MIPHEMPSIDKRGAEAVMVEAEACFADDFAEHRETAPALAGHERESFVSLALKENRNGHAHISNRSASTGGSSAARRAG